MQEVLNYDELVRKYYENLHATLRSFHSGPEFLQTWVHDEDHKQSIFGIFEAAHLEGVISLALEISQGLIGDIDWNWLEKQIAGLGGRCHRVQTQKGLTLSVTFLKKVVSQEVHPVYRTAIQSLSKTTTHEGELKAQPPYLLCTVMEGSTSLAAWIDERSNVVEAKHIGAEGSLRVMLDQTCNLMIGRPIQEAADHCIIRLEYLLRDKNLPPPVSGIITPESVAPLFTQVTSLVRALFSEYCKQTQKGLSPNYWTDRPSPEWASLSEPQKILKIKDGIGQACRELAIQNFEIDVVCIKNQHRAFLSNALHPNPQIARHIIRIERWLRDHVEPAIELYFESLEDKNKREQKTSR